MHTEIYEPKNRDTFAVVPGEPSDEELMAGIQQEDDYALTALYQRHSTLVRTIIARVISNDHDVDDLLQGVFLEIWRQAAHFDHTKGKALGWIVTLARRRAIDKVRRRQAYHRATESLRLEAECEPMLCEGADDEAMVSDVREILQRLLAHLPEAQRQAIHLAYYEGLSQREIAMQTGIPLGTIKTRLELAVRKVRHVMLALGGESTWRAELAHTQPHSSHR